MNIHKLDFYKPFKDLYFFIFTDMKRFTFCVKKRVVKHYV